MRIIAIECKIVVSLLMMLMICVLVGGDMYDVYDCSRCDVLCLSQLMKVWFTRNVSSANDLHHIIDSVAPTRD